jgi:LuxR family maltose regulon positive regulatory protein
VAACDREAWQPWIALNAAGTLAISLVEAGHGEQCDRVLREAGPLAEAIERDGREASAPGLAWLRIAEGRRRYQSGDFKPPRSCCAAPSRSRNRTRGRRCCS